MRINLLGSFQIFGRERPVRRPTRRQLHSQRPPPASFAAVPASAVTLAQGGVLQLLLQLTGQVSGVAFLDWDGDGRQQPDEPAIGLPLTLTLSSGAGTQLADAMSGLGLFLGTPAGSYTLAATATACASRGSRRWQACRGRWPGKHLPPTRTAATHSITSPQGRTR